MIRLTLLLAVAATAGCAAARRAADDPGYRGIEEVRILAKGME